MTDSKGRNLGLNEKLQEAVSYLRNKKLNKAVSTAVSVIHLAEESGDYYTYANAQNVLGVIYVAQGNEMLAIDCYLKGLDCCNTYHIRALLPLFYTNIGSRYQELGDYSTAIDYFLKSNECLEFRECQEDPRYRGWCLINSLNLVISCTHQKQYSFGEQFLIRAESLLAPEEKHTSLGIALLIIKCTHYWCTDRRGFVYDHLDEVIDNLHNMDASDLIQGIHETCYLLKDMQEYDRWERVLSIFRDYAAEQQSPYFQMLVCESELDYYRTTGDTDAYRAACIRHTEYYLQQQKEHMQGRADAITQKIMLQQKEAERRNAELQAKIDPLTRLGNRKLLEEEFSNYLEYAKVHHLMLCIAIVDIDHFKQHNDTYGHMHGDKCLVQVASELKRCIRSSGNVYRFGGDEFVLVLAPTSVDEIRETAIHIKKNMVEMQIGNSPENGTYITVSQGYAFCSADYFTSKNALLAKADEALYAVKDSGRNDYRIFEC